MELIYFGIIVFIIVVFTYLLFKEKRKIKFLNQIMVDTQRETSATIANQQEIFKIEKSNMYHKKMVEQAFNKITTENNKKLYKLESEHKKNIEEYETRIEKLAKYIQSLEKQSRNFGEIITYKILLNLKDNLKNQGIIKDSEMIILPNVFVPVENNGEIKSRQIDHLVLTRKGTYIIETKYWKGTIFYGISKEEAKEFSFILDNLFPDVKSEDEKTIVFLEGNNEGESTKKDLKVVSYDDPAKQVKTTAFTLNKLLKDNGENIYVTPIIYFGYPGKTFKSYSRNNSPHVFDRQESLEEFFYKELSNESNKELSHDQLERIKNIIKKVNYIS